MDSVVQWWSGVRDAMFVSLADIGAYVPRLAASLLVMLLGLIAARIMRSILRRSGHGLNDLLDRFAGPLGVKRLKVSQRFTTFVANLAFWVVILLFAAVAARVAGLDAFSGWLDRVVDYLPTLIAGILITVVGYLLGSLARDAVGAALGSTQSVGLEYAGLAAQTAVFVTAIVIGLDQIGIDVTFLTTIVAVLVGVAALSIAIAFGFGAREFVGNLIAARQVQGTVQIGDKARIGAIEGRVLEITPTAVVIINESGRVVVPATLFQREPVVLLAGETDE